MPGQVFVIQGDVRTLRCDARLLPVYDQERPKAAWLHDDERPLPGEPPPAEWREGDARCFWFGAVEGGPDLWVTRVGLDGHTRDLDWALASVEVWLERALERLRSKGRRVPKRALPLLAMHLVASGQRNAARSMGALVSRVLDVVEGFATRSEADVAIVARDREQYTALQAARQQRKTLSALPPELAPLADRLAEAARVGQLCVLTGAGISMGAGLPSWWGLLHALAEQVKLGTTEFETLATTGDAPQQAEEIANRFPSQRAFHDAVAALCNGERVALTHGFLASMPVSEFVTLNYDTLFETAAKGASRAIDVIPHDRKGAGSAWLLKLHGCRTRPDEIVLTSSDYKGFEERRIAFRGLVQSLLFTRHMLFVGFGMTDPNISALIDLVLTALDRTVDASGPSLGTILTLRDDKPRPAWHHAFEIVPMTRGAGDDAERARLLEVLLDRVALEACDPFEHLLDERFDGLLGNQGQAVREAASRFAEELAHVGAGTPAAARLVRTLREMGLRTPATARLDGPVGERSRSSSTDRTETRARPTGPLPIVAVADLHGHDTLFGSLLAHLDGALPGGYRLVLLGDYVDNGPEIPPLLDRLIALEKERGDRFEAILGNHDLACLRSIGWRGAAPDEAWFDAWSRRYWNAGRGTPSAYGARTAAELASMMPAAHRDFLQRRPWFAEFDGHLFVHAGLTMGPVAPQLDALRGRPLLERQHTVAPLRDKDLACVSDPAWGVTVVSGHTRQPFDRAPRDREFSRSIARAALRHADAYHALVGRGLRRHAVGGGTANTKVLPRARRRNGHDPGRVTTT